MLDFSREWKAEPSLSGGEGRLWAGTPPLPAGRLQSQPQLPTEAGLSTHTEMFSWLQGSTCSPSCHIAPAPVWSGGEGRGPNRAARLAACSGGIFLHQKPKSPVQHLFSSPSHGPASLPHPTVVPKGFLLFAVPAPQPSTSPICITSRQHWLERQECKQALGSTVSMHVTTILAAAGDTAPALGSALQHPRTQPCHVEVTLTFPLGAMASQAGNHWSEGKEELWKGTEKST